MFETRVQFRQLVSHEVHEDVEGDVDLFHVKAVEGEEEVSIHQVREASEGILLLAFIMNEDGASHIAHALNIAKVWSEHRVG